MAVRKIVSGGQTGVDRAVLNVARVLGLERGGWCPRGRLAEDGRIPDEYPLRETETSDYSANSRSSRSLTQGRTNAESAPEISLAASHRGSW
jgi:hypothetical protein